ncbi:gliding motility-associated C-terminal domain-containing protein [uncultured Marivirga sp.]|uniref:T9SS type B sorting domain-containing protein n=1 Tax=uncultured Marivirga sp. TaxID=1123707 RepID=UPI0030EC9B1C|tara:strand:- start:322038 stop:324506 length:2469 start_codon:yes stop_codon:yes gene_type:complete
MNKLSTLIYALIFINPVWLCGQQLNKIDSAQIPAEKIVNSNWLDINNNSIHELVLQSEIGEDSTILLSFDWTIQRVDTLNNLVLSSNPVQINDMDNNNQLDILGYTRDSVNDLSLTILYQDAGGFERVFQEKFEGLQKFFIQDWDKDGLKDLLLLQESNDSLALSILKNSPEGIDTEQDLLTNLAQNTQLNFLDIDQNGRMDILLTSNNSVLPTIPKLIFNHKDSIETRESKLPKASYSSIGLGDYNHDGKMDFFASTVANENTADLAVFINENADFENSVSIDFQDFSPKFSFLADFNSDGLTDVFVSDTLKSTIIYQGIENEIASEIIPDSENRIFNFYDEDLDGDLDISAISKEAKDSLGVSMDLIDNQTPQENLPPSVPSFHTAFQTSEGVIIVWNDAQDDHTSAKNISYDLFIGKNSYNTEVLAPNFDINSSQRLQTARGNNFYGNELKFDSISAGQYSYGIQPIDNSLTSRVIAGLCPPGSGDRYMAYGEFEICESIGESTIKTCLDSEIVLGDSSKARYWYSEEEGFLGISDSLLFTVKSEDIIYARDVEFTDCDSYHAYTINIIEEGNFESEDIVLCEADEIELNFSGDADSIKWYSQTKGFLSDDFNTSILFENEDQVRYEAFFNGCLIEGGFSVRFDNSQVEITNKSFQIKRGGSVQLNATGAMNYDWFPAISLNQDNISNPVASPEVTTKYIVRGTSQFGCTSQDTIEVKVLQEAFIPELFTPNGDSRNDRLRIFGLADIAEFEFVVFDREGNVVFKSNNASKMSTTGWDGTKGGNKAEAGVYFWQVRGQFKDGEPIRLNGQEKGKVLLSK